MIIKALRDCISYNYTNIGLKSDPYDLQIVRIDEVTKGALYLVRHCEAFSLLRKICVITRVSNNNVVNDLNDDEA